MSAFPLNKLRITHPLTAYVVAVFLYALCHLLWKTSWLLGCLSWTALDTFDEHCWIQSSTFINKCHYTFECMYLYGKCTLHFAPNDIMRYKRGQRTQAEYRTAHTITRRGTRQEFNYFFLFPLFIRRAHYALMCVWPSGEAGFWQCPSSLQAGEHLRDEMHPDTQGWFSPPLTPAGGHHDLITGGNE